MPSRTRSLSMDLLDMQNIVAFSLLIPATWFTVMSLTPFSKVSEVVQSPPVIGIISMVPPPSLTSMICAVLSPAPLVQVSPTTLLEMSGTRARVSLCVEDREPVFGLITDVLMLSPMIETFSGTIRGSVSLYVPALTQMVAGPVMLSTAKRREAKDLEMFSPLFRSLPLVVT